MTKRGPRYCECGELITRKFSRYCDRCGHARMSNGGYISITTYNRIQAQVASRRTQYQTVPVKAICPKCRRTHDVEMRRDPGRTVWEFCKHHKGLRQMEYVPTAGVSDAIRITG